MKVSDLKAVIESIMTPEFCGSSYFGSLMLNGGIELAFRSVLLNAIHVSLSGGDFAVAEYTMVGHKYKRADIAILDGGARPARCKAIIEIKSNFVPQSNWIRTYADCDLAKWRIPDCPPLLAIYMLTEVHETPGCSMPKPEAKARSREYNEQKLSQAIAVLSGNSGGGYKWWKSFDGSSPYPNREAKSKFTVHFLLAERH